LQTKEKALILCTIYKKSFFCIQLFPDTKLKQIFNNKKQKTATPQSATVFHSSFLLLHYPLFKRFLQQTVAF